MILGSSTPAQAYSSSMWVVTSRKVKIGTQNVHIVMQQFYNTNRGIQRDKKGNLSWGPDPLSPKSMIEINSKYLYILFWWGGGLKTLPRPPKLSGWP